MKKSEESISDELLRKLASLDVDYLKPSQPSAGFTRVQLEIVRQVRNDLAHSHDLGHFSGINEVKARFEKAELFNEIKKRLKQLTLLPQESESKTETAKSFASTARESETMNSLPPKNAEFLLALFLDKEDQEAAIGCFMELYAKRVVRWGKSRARVWAWVQVGKTLVPVLKRVVLKVSGLIAAYEWLKHHLS